MFFFNLDATFFINLNLKIKTNSNMKKIISVVVISFLLFSCSSEGDNYRIVTLPIAKVEPETAFAKDSVTEITVKYLRPSNCHFYEDFYYDRYEFTRVVAIYNVEMDRDDCQAFQNDTVSVPLKFKPSELGTYVFKFWKGTNASGEEEFYELEAIVNH